jgi:hypothetical protein
MATTRKAKLKKGKSMQKGSYTLTKKGSKKTFGGTLLETINWGKTRLAIFSVPKGKS